MSARAYAARDVVEVNAHVRASDEALFVRARSGDEAALEQLYVRHFHALRRVAERVVHDTEAADDVVSDVFRRIAVGNERCARTHVRRWLVAATHAAAVASKDGGAGGQGVSPPTSRPSSRSRSR